MSIDRILARKGPRKLLTIDGGSVRAVIAVQILKKIETILREQSRNPALVLADYFDYVAGLQDAGVPAAATAQYNHLLVNSFGAHSADITIDVDHPDLQDRDRLL